LDAVLRGVGHHQRARRIERPGRRHRPEEHRPARHRVENFGSPGVHADALAGGQDNYCYARLRRNGPFGPRGGVGAHGRNCRRLYLGICRQLCRASFPGRRRHAPKAMRGIPGAALGLLLLAGAVFTGRPVDAEALGGLNTVTVSPAHGKAGVAFRVTYAISPCQGAPGLTISFSWGGLAPTGKVLGTAVTDSACRATLSTAPPATSAPGVYQVFGYVALPTGDPTPNTETAASYTVDVAPLPTASSSATARPSASGTTAASASASPSASASALASTPVPPATQATAAAGKSAGSWSLSWIVPLGLGVLALAILAAIWFLIAAMTRRRARAATGNSNDRAA